MVKKYLSISSKTIFISIISLAFSFLLLKLQIGLLGVEQRGILILTQANVAVLITLARFGIGQSVIGLIPKHDRSILSANFIFLTSIQGLLIGTIVLIILKSTNFFGNQIENISLFMVVVYSITSLFFNAISSFSFLIISSKEFAIQTLLFGFFNIFFLYTISKILPVGINTVLLCVITAQIFAMIYISKLLPRFNFRFLKKDILKNFFYHGARNIGWSFLKDLSYKIDLLIFGNTLSSYDFGIYSILQNLCQSVWRVTDPMLASYTKYLLTISKDIYIKFTNNVIWILTSLTFLSLGLSYFIITPVFGFISGIDLTRFLFPALILLYAIFIFNIWKLIANFFIQIGYHLPMYITLGSLIILFLVLKTFVKTLNEGVYTTAFAYSLVSLLMIFFYKRVNRYHPFGSIELS